MARRPHIRLGLFALSATLLLAMTIATPLSRAVDPGFEPPEPPLVRAHTEPVELELVDPGKREVTAAKGHRFLFARYLNNCGPIGTVKRIEARERPSGRPGGPTAVFLTVIVHFPAYHQVPLCPPPESYYQQILRVKTGPPASSLVYYDASTKPPRRLWPVGNH